MRIKINYLILNLILLFPMLLGVATLTGIGFEINIYYFFLIALVAAIFNFHKFSTRQYKAELFIQSMLLLVLLSAVLQGGQLRYTMPILYIATLIIFFGLSRVDDYGAYNRGIELTYVKLYFLLSVIFLFFSSSYAMMGRFSGFTGSSTTYSIYLTVFVILVLAGNFTRKTKIIVYLVGLVFVALTLTRLNLIFYLLVPFFFYFSQRSFTYRLVVLIGFVAALNSVYPVYSIIIEKYPGIIELRYSEGRDASFGLRYALHNTIATNWEEASLKEKLFGHGMESSRLLIIKEFDNDLLPHNDFIRFAYDFGVLPLLFFSLAMFKIIMRNRTTFMLGFLYLLSFYHNMIYNFFVIMLIIMYYKIHSAYEDRTEQLSPQP